MEPAVLPGSFASPSALAHIAVQKFVMYSPLYRLEKEYERQGLKLSRQTMSNWLLRASEDWLEPIYDALHAQLCRQHVLHADETTLQVLREKDKCTKPLRGGLRESSAVCIFVGFCSSHTVVDFSFQAFFTMKLPIPLSFTS